MPSRSGRSTLHPICLAALLCAASSPALGDTLYEWIDQAGNIRYGGAPPPGVSYRIVSEDSGEPGAAALDADDETALELEGPDEEPSASAAQEPLVLSPEPQFPAAGTPTTASSSSGAGDPRPEGALLEALRAERDELYRGDPERIGTWAVLCLMAAGVGRMLRSRRRRNPRKLA